MISPQEIREKTFEKAMFGGYDMTQVDDYLAAVSTDIQATQKEISTLKSKMKVLVDKIEEYRGNEDAMRMALLSAQKISAQIQNEAEQKCAEMLEDAQLKSQATLEEVKTQVAAQENILLGAKQKSAEFIEHMRVLSQKHIEFLDAVSASAPELKTVRQADPQNIQQPASAGEKAPDSPPDRAQGDSTAEADSVSKLPAASGDEDILAEYDPEDDEDSHTKHFTPAVGYTPAAPKFAKPRVNFDELRFGNEE